MLLPMKAGFASRRRIEAPAATRLLRNPRALRFVGGFMARSRPELLSAVAREVEMPLSSAWRMASRLVACGVLRVHDTTPRAGRALKRYEAVAQVLFVPYEAEGDRLPDDVVRRLVGMRVEEQVRGLIAAAGITRDGTGATSWGTLIYTDRRGQLVVRPDFEAGRTPGLLRPNTPAYLNFYSDDLRLTRAAAKRLQIELVALLKKYKACEGPHLYTLSAVLAPRVRGGVRERRTP